MIVLNGPEAIDSQSNDVEIIASNGDLQAVFYGPKAAVAQRIMDVVDEQLIERDS